MALFKDIFQITRQLSKPLLIYSLLVMLASCENQSQKQPKDPVEAKINDLLSQMTLEEKIGQTSQRGTSSRGKGVSEELKEKVRKGLIGSMLNVKNPDDILLLQRIAVEESPNGIPLIFARDVIHGYKTIFPIPLGQAATWNPELVKRGAEVSAAEAAGDGIKWTFAPMLDISRDPRWGRIAESAGEDPYLTSEMGKAYVSGFQGKDLSAPQSVIACAKHFVGYGAAEGGRDYNTAVISEDQLYNTYLRPFQSAIDVGVGSVMAGFNEVNGIPMTGNQKILREILRNEWQFDGVVVSDWESATEMIHHGYARDKKEVALKSVLAGMDIEMTSDAYELQLKRLIQEKIIQESELDALVRNILRLKIQAGLFENPYFEKQDNYYAEAHLQAAKATAVESIVLLKNKNLLPLNNSDHKIALIGPLADAPHEQLGTWVFDSEKEYSVTPKSSFEQKLGDKLIFAKGLEYSRSKSKKGFSKAISAARKSDVIVFIGGEEAILSGEAHSRADIRLPGAQETLIKQLARVGKPIVLIIMAGRPITVSNIIEDVDAILMAWHPGTMAGPAIFDVVSGKVSPSGKLPVSWPKSVGQIPIYYNHKNTGRPADDKTYVHINDIPVRAWQSSLGNRSHYLDDGYEPLWDFGFGLTYSEIEILELECSHKEFNTTDKIVFSFKVKNSGNMKVKETMQLYYQDVFASITRPVKELVRFQKINLEAGEEKKMKFTINSGDLKFYNPALKDWTVEEGEFRFWVGNSSKTNNSISVVFRNE
ncbi:glycoside hydrolase family 3 N-terminal domain-containing protein [Reichenbachiella versicolor]|uniref:glycoside hydrolase family 3 N-terminal domain-containing protein n=1 Tax=Reichenbachiella versicolor TaxID=1821036 RepID=UPI001C8818FD|nr:glycoside hydrolase family 3 N-terminal domain-containing protein [Reichenbachiella versicolor]